MIQVLKSPLKGLKVQKLLIQEHLRMEMGIRIRRISTHYLILL